MGGRSQEHLKINGLPKRIVLLSGRVASGKSLLGESLCERYSATLVKTRKIIQKLKPEVPDEREALQHAGTQLDHETSGAWIAQELSLMNFSDIVVVDSVRIAAQVEAIRKAFGTLRVTHIHVSAGRSILVERYARRVNKIKELPTYDDVENDPTEAQVDNLIEICDVLIDTGRNTPSDILVRAAARMGLYQVQESAFVDVLIGGEYGSEGKGHIAWYLAREYDVLVRVGGPNAGHTVLFPGTIDGQKRETYIFHQLPSGTQEALNATIVIGPGATIWLPQLFQEISECDVEYNRIAIDPQAMVIEKWDREYEQALKEEIASTAQGGGIAAARRLMRNKLKGDDVPKVILASDVPDLRPHVKPTCEVLDDAFASGKRVLLEGTQGTGLSLYHGSYPYVTSRDTTASGTMAEAGIPPSRIRRVIMVTRSYPIRVQNPDGAGKTSGPMSIEISWEEIAARSGLSAKELRIAEKTSTTKRQRRVGEFDWALFRKSCSLNGPTDIALTFADYLSSENQQARRFEQLTTETIMFVEELERVSNAPVTLISTRFNERSIIDRRSW
ncbi:MAG: adenylosuccinate synthetase [Vulcanimicrobiaceae bacterium]